MIDVQNITKTFGAGEAAVHALKDVTVTIRQNEFFTLLGPSGCGKTTLLRLIAGFDHPTSGVMELNGKDISYLPPNKRPINTVFQNYALFPHMTVAQNISFGLEMLDRPKAEIKETVDRMLALVKMEALRNRRISEISGGQQQRVALARALAPQPEVLLLDEPLSALDLKLRKEMQLELKRLQSETGITFVFVTHDQEEALTMSDRIAVMSGGNILQIGAPREIYSAPTSRFVADFIGETNFIEAEVADAGAVLKGGQPIAVPADRLAGHAGTVTLAIRPEQMQLVGEGEGIPATLTQAVYSGTDLHWHVELDDGTPLVVRTRTAPDGSTDLVPGARVGVSLPAGAIQVLED
jgi:spermidine/putrescine transport system ATP-binding protein